MQVWVDRVAINLARRRLDAVRPSLEEVLWRGQSALGSVGRHGDGAALARLLGGAAERVGALVADHANRVRWAEELEGRGWGHLAAGAGASSGILVSTPFDQAIETAVGRLDDLAASPGFSGRGEAMAATQAELEELRRRRQQYLVGLLSRAGSYIPAPELAEILRRIGLTTGGESLAEVRAQLVETLSGDHAGMTETEWKQVMARANLLASFDRRFLAVLFDELGADGLDQLMAEAELRARSYMYGVVWERETLRGLLSRGLTVRNDQLNFWTYGGEGLDDIHYSGLDVRTQFLQPVAELITAGVVSGDRRWRYWMLAGGSDIVHLHNQIWYAGVAELPQAETLDLAAGLLRTDPALWAWVQPRLEAYTELGFYPELESPTTAALGLLSRNPEASFWLLYDSPGADDWDLVSLLKGDRLPPGHSGSDFDRALASVIESATSWGWAGGYSESLSVMWNDLVEATEKGSIVELPGDQVRAALAQYGQLVGGFQAHNKLVADIAQGMESLEVTAGEWSISIWNHGESFIARRGSPDAKHVVVYIPGTGTDVFSSVDMIRSGGSGSETSRGENLWNALLELDKEIGSDFAVVIALPYDPYDTVLENLRKCSDGYCEESATAIAQVLGDFDSDQNVMVIAHSLGSAVTGHAFMHYPELAGHVDNVTLVGSPGVPQRRASEFGTDVVVAIAPDDGIHWAQDAWSPGPPSFLEAMACAAGGWFDAACEPTTPWSSHFGAEVYWVPDYDYDGWDGKWAHGVYLDKYEIVRDLVRRGITGKRVPS